jgi:hypothetical protein
MDIKFHGTMFSITNERAKDTPYFNSFLVAARPTDRQMLQLPRLV